MDALTGMEGLIIIGAITILVGVIAIIVLYIKIVPEGRRLVIYRFGRFHRIAGLGPVYLIPGRDRVVKEIEVRNHPVEITVPSIFAYGVPNDLRLNLWYKVDIEEVTQGDKNKQMELTKVSEAEREWQIRVLVREVLINRVAELQKQMPLPDGATLLDGIAAMAPGTERYKALVKGITAELEQTLPSVGVILNATHPVSLVGRGIPDDIIEAVKRKRSRTIDSDWLKEYANKLRKQFPDISNTGSLPLEC